MFKKRKLQLILLFISLIITLTGCNTDRKAIVKKMDFPQAVRKGEEVELSIELSHVSDELSYSWVASKGEFIGDTNDDKVVYKAPLEIGTDMIKVAISDGRHTLIEKKNIKIYSSEYQVAFGGKGNDIFRSVKGTPDGGVIVAGYTESIGLGEKDGYVVKLDFKGDQQWSETFGGQEHDRFRSVLRTKDGNYILVGYKGYIDLSKQRSYAGYIVNINSKGNKLWEKSLMKDDNLYLSSIQELSDGNYITVGNIGRLANSDGLVVKLGPAGIKLQEERFNITNKYVNFRDVQETADGGYIIVGYIVGDENIDNRGYVIKVDSNLNLEWEKNYGTKLYAVQVIDNNKYILVGSKGTKGYLAKIDLTRNGAKDWSRTFSKGVNDRAVFYSVQKEADGGYILAGCNRGYFSNFDAYILKTDQNGSEIWSKLYGGNGNDVFYSIEKFKDTGYILTGYTESFNSNRKDGYVLKIDSQGNTEGKLMN